MKTLLTCLFWIAVMSVQGSHLLGGYITYKPVGSPSSFTYEITVVQFADNKDGKAAHRDDVFVDFGDGTDGVAEGHLTKIPVAPNVWRNVYKTTHSYPGDGCYIISTPLSNEFGNLMNVTAEAELSPQSQLCISTSFGTVRNSSPQMTEPFIFLARTDSVYKFNPIFMEHDTDSVALSLQGLGKGYRWPSEIEPFKNSYQIVDDELIWDKPNVPGRYLLALLQEEYRMIMTPEGDVVTEKIGYVIYWWIVNVEGLAKASNPDSRTLSVLQQEGSLRINHSEITDGDVMLFNMAGKNVGQARLINGQCQLLIPYGQKGVHTLVVNSDNGIQTKKLMLH